jgi:hypothetical protein
MPTSNMAGVDTLHGFHLPVTTFLSFTLGLSKTQFPEQSFRLLGVQLQRYVTSLHTFLLNSDGGFQRTNIQSLTNGTERSNNCQARRNFMLKFHVATVDVFCYI